MHFQLKTIPSIICCFLLCALLPSEEQKTKAIQTLLNQSIKQHKVPGLLAAIIDHQGIRSIAASGVRQHDRNEQLSIHDHVHIGSCTKAMTATLLAKCIEEGTLSWDDTLKILPPHITQRLDNSYLAANLWQMVTHRSNMPGNAKNWWSHNDKRLVKRRLSILQDNLSVAPQQKDNSFLYSNLSFMAAGCMAEHIYKKTWEDLIQEKLFKELDMKNVGFGPPGNSKTFDQPRGHIPAGSSWKTMYHDNAEALGPAGRVHCSIEDWAKFLAVHLNPSKQKYLKPTSLKKLHTPSGTYAGGWVVVTRPWAKGVTLSHNGSNTMWHAVVWLAPNIDRGYIVVTNSCNEQSPKICDGIVGRLIQIDQQP